MRSAEWPSSKDSWYVDMITFQWFVIGATVGLGMKILQKAGSCVTGKYLTESDAGKINGEVFRGFSTTDLAVFAEWNNKLTAEDQEVVDKVLALVESKSVAFANALSATD